jgi:hypothetical protein
MEQVGRSGSRQAHFADKAVWNALTVDLLAQLRRSSRRSVRPVHLRQQFCRDSSVSVPREVRELDDDVMRRPHQGAEATSTGRLSDPKSD